MAESNKEKRCRGLFVICMRRRKKEKVEKEEKQDNYNKGVIKIKDKQQLQPSPTLRAFPHTQTICLSPHGQANFMFELNPGKCQLDRSLLISALIKCVTHRSPTFPHSYSPVSSYALA